MEAAGASRWLHKAWLDPEVLNTRMIWAGQIRLASTTISSGGIFRRCDLL